ncbi:avenin-3-like [Lolium rigidum]|uniref:avenin-3-like n=1 Tax=Lolium rigidum TaxID=89674 RepID=UPI001F5DDE66|nr:avenin-3-like [Lolium rigidum]
MKTFLILALLSVVATMANATVELDHTEQSFPQPHQQFPQPQQPFPEQQQPCVQQQQQVFQPIVQQLLNPCRDFLVQRCNPVAMVPFLRSQILQQSSCEVMRQQCCQQLVQIPKQLQYPAIYSIVNSGFSIVNSGFSMQQQQQGQGLCQPQPQQAGQGFIQAHDLAKFEAMRNFALQTLPAMCKVQVPLYYSTSPYDVIAI